MEKLGVLGGDTLSGALWQRMFVEELLLKQVLQEDSVLLQEITIFDGSKPSCIIVSLVIGQEP